ncbi:RNA polymerase factor sigma-54 [Halobacillus yeomjeoni]|uniref:RNA polymerase factor sigma-54 n=1 Tax=Halobacillus yeomjeoni TaxID=311194 RepID=A0A931MVH0_9BACI|nr:RNA polymerase factor sigma-54 [Halobacillus yeomjeoni]MBH0230324.1 RNA polymerase factor sigma-54 [Halobacillus yeomjeoni]
MKLQLTQNQTTKLYMSTEMRQAVTILQCSQAQLIEFIEEKSLENPLISIENPRGMNGTPSQTRPMFNPADIFVASEQGWREKIIDYFKWNEVNIKPFKIMKYLILNLDEKGFLPLTIEEIAASMSSTRSEIEKQITKLKAYDTMGLGCFNLREYLLYQIENDYPTNYILHKLVSDYLEEASDRKWKFIAQNLNVSEEEVKAAFSLLKNLNPQPKVDDGNRFVDYLIPDIIVEEKGGEFFLKDTNSLTPLINLNSQLASLTDINSDAKSFIEDCYKEARWLMNSIEQRRATIIQVVEAILYKQSSFFYGNHLIPMTYKQVGEMIGVHESTVSRAVAHKVIQTPRGTYNLKEFFTPGLKNGSDVPISSSEVKEMIKRLIDGEDKGNPLSDQQIVNKIIEIHPVTISRRTVAKYRESMNIRASSKRKE